MKVKTFEGEFSFLSNFYPCTVVYGGMIFSSSEHAYQAAKTMNLEDRRDIAACPTPGAAKHLGQEIKLRPDWDEVKELVMVEILVTKFIMNTDLKEKLLATGDAELEEGNTWYDVYWGIDLKTGRGLNRLGQILMDVREIIR